MFLLVNKEKLRKSLLVDDAFYASSRRSNVISSSSLAIIATGAVVMYHWYTPTVEQSQNLTYAIYVFVVLAALLILDNILELKFLKKLLHEQSSANLFSDEEWHAIQEAAQRPGISDKASIEVEAVSNK